MSWLQPKKEGLHFILSDNNNYDFDVKVRYCGFVGFINDMVDCGCLKHVFCFRIKEKEKDTLLIDLCVQFTINVFYDGFITNKVL